jgi:small conductance mechanosensitive channel
MMSIESGLWLEVVKPLLHLVLILVLAWFAMRLARRLVALFKTQMERQSHGAEEAKRIETLSRVFRYTATVVISLVAGMLVLTELGISVAPILAAAGVAGLAVGFGAQSLVKDFFTGFFLLLENQVRVGDIVEAGGKSGQVEELTLRYIRLRDYDGNVHFVPNGIIQAVTNSTRDYSYSVADVGVGYRENLNEVFSILRRTGAELRHDPEHGPRILEDLEIAGVQALGDSAIVIRSRFKVAPMEQWNVRRAYLQRIKQAFDNHGIEIPFPQRTVHTVLGSRTGQADKGIQHLPASSSNEGAG